MYSRIRPVLQQILMAGALLMVLIACLPAQSVPVSPTPTFSRFFPPTWTATVTLNSSPTTTPTLTQTPTPTINPTLPPSLTPLPTISFDNALWDFEVLLATNGGCRLPCFWGITPGKTTVAEMHQFVDHFPTDLVDFEDYLSMIILYEDQQILGVYFLFPNEFDGTLYCYDPQFSPLGITTWAAGQSWQGFIDQEAQALKPLEDVTDYDIHPSVIF